MKKISKGSQGGFSLIEMIVASSIFVIIMVIIVGALISLNNSNRKARTISLVTDNLSAAIDSMSRNIRMGSNYHCGCGAPATPFDANFPNGVRDCPMSDSLGSGGDSCFAFEGPLGDPTTASDQTVYRLNGSRIERSKDSGVTFIPLTAPEVKITDMHFYVYGTQINVTQPVVTMVIRGVTGVTPKTATNFNIETTVESRTPNFSVGP